MYIVYIPDIILHTKCISLVLFGKRAMTISLYVYKYTANKADSGLYELLVGKLKLSDV